MMFYSPGRRVRLMRFWRGGVLHLWFELKCRPALHHADTDRPHSGLGRDLIGFQWFLAQCAGERLPGAGELPRHYRRAAAGRSRQLDLVELIGV